MLIKRPSEIALGFLLGIALFVLMASIFSGQTDAPQNQAQKEPANSDQLKQPPSNYGAMAYDWTIEAQKMVAAYLDNTANYCTTERTEKKEKWSQDFICSIKITDVVISIFSVLLVFVTVGLVGVGWIQARRMRVTARQQLRAYMFVDNITMGNVTTPLVWEVVPGYVPTGAEITHTAFGPAVRMVIKNTGQTPAHYVINWGDMVLREFPLKGKLLNSQRSLFITKTSIPANGISTKGLIMPKPLLADEVGDLKRGTKAIYVFGYIKYRDAFGRRRRTRYRLMHGNMSGGIGITTELTICDAGNDAR